MSQEVMIPPWVRPESPETIRMIDDATVAFQPAFGRGMTQRGIFADPRWGLRRRYRGLRSDEKAAILNALNESRGQLNILRVTPHAPIRGSFATSELLTNNTFANGTTGWTASAGGALTVADRVARLAVSAVGSNPQFSQSVALTQYAPHVLRVFVADGAMSVGLSMGPAIDGGITANGYSTSRGMLSVAVTALDASAHSQVPLVYVSTSGYVAGAYVLIPYTSLSRCALVDGGANLLQRSDEFDNAYWTKTNLTAPADGAGAPDGTTTAELFTENNTNGGHFVTSDTVTVAAAASDYAFSCALAPSGRGWAFMQLSENTGATAAVVFFNITTGVVGTIQTGANWSNVRAFMRPLGSSYYACTVVARKTNAATSLSALIGAATADTVNSYTGTTSLAAIAAWRATLAQSSVSTRLAQTTSAATTGTAQTGSALHTKGWPASTDGLLLTGDWFEWQGELKQLTAPVNSDAAGLAYLQFRPGLAGTPADNDPIIVFEPFGRFIYPGTREFENLFGIYADCEMNLEEVYS